MIDRSRDRRRKSRDRRRGGALTSPADIASALARDEDPPLRVLLSFPPPRDVYNPYTIMLTEAVRAVPGAEVDNFTWRRALLGSYDVFHVHWPENLVSGQSPLKTLVRQVLFVAFLERIRRRRVALVRTLHNLDRPSGISRVESLLLDSADRRTHLWITLNDFTPVPPGAAHAAIPHGHYREWFRPFARSPEVRGRICYFGRIRRYKGVERLVSAFKQIDEVSTGPIRLWIGGLPSSPDLVQSLIDLIDGDERVSLDLGFQSDADIVSMVSTSELVVLPYVAMHNSGASLAALSLDTPVLVPDNEVNRALALEVGPAWVQVFAGELDSDALTSALLAVRTADRSDRPDLSRRQWPEAGFRHVAAYRRAVDLAVGRGR